MDFIDEVRTRCSRFTERVKQLTDKEATEEATKTSFVLPFIQILGYDIFNPSEVIPEFTADIGTKKGEKVDYALIQDGNPVVLIECKKLGTKLSSQSVSQLLRYFDITEARVGILTDGIFYRFFSDLDQSNIMDPRSFFEFNMLEFTDPEVEQLKRFTKDKFDKSQIEDAARDLRYTAEIKHLLTRELSKPSDDFVRYVIKQVYEGRVSLSVRRMFKDLALSAFNQFITDKIQDRLSSALKQEGDAVEEKRKEEKEEKAQPEFTRHETHALNTLKAILGGVVDARRLQLRQTKRYSSVVLHSTPEKEDYGVVLFRLWAKRANSLVLEGRDITKLELDTIETLFAHTDALRRAVKDNYLTPPPGAALDMPSTEND